MAFDPSTLLRMLGINPEAFLKEAENFKRMAEAMEARITAIEEKQDRVIALLEGVHDALASGDAFDFGQHTYEAKNGHTHTKTEIF